MVNKWYYNYNRVAELNRILIALNEVMEEDGMADYSNVLKQCESIVIDGRLPDTKLSVDFALAIALIQKKGRKLILTDNGRYFLELNPEKLFELSSEQKRLLIRICYLHGFFRSTTLELLKSFVPYYEENTFKLSIADSHLTEEHKTIVEHLVQLQLLVRIDVTLEVNSQYVDTVASFISEGKGWSEESAEKYYKERKEVGDIAEKLILEFEKNRLKKMGCGVESVSIRQVSKLRVNAGYDIDSFNGKTPNLNYDRFIEVKGAKDSKFKIYWTDNEIRIAKKLANKYWIYFQGGIDTKTKTAKNTPILIQNPAELILKSPDFTKTPQGIIIEGNLTGKLVKSRKA